MGSCRPQKTPLTHAITRHLSLGLLCAAPRARLIHHSIRLHLGSRIDALPLALRRVRARRKDLNCHTGLEPGLPLNAFRAVESAATSL